MNMTDHILQGQNAPDHLKDYADHNTGASQVHSDAGATDDDTAIQHESPRDRSRAIISDFSTRLRNLPIAAKVHIVLWSFIAVLLMMVAVAAIGMGNIYTRYSASTAIATASAQSIELRSLMGEIRYHAVRYIIAEEASSADALHETVGKTRNRIADIRTTTQKHTPDLLPQLSAIETGITTYNGEFDRMRASLNAEGRSARSNAIAEDLSRTGDTIYEDILAFDDALQYKVTTYQQRGMQQFKSLCYAVITLIALAFLVLTAGVRYLSRDLGVKIAEITAGMKRLARGSPNFEIEGRERKDEIGDMIRALDVFKLGNMRLTEQAKAAEVRLEKERALELENQQQADRLAEERRSMLQSLADRFERTIGEIVSGVASASSQLMSTAGDMAATADQSSERSNSVVQYMGEASDGVTAAAAASDEFAMSIGEISRQAASSAELARNASDSAQEADSTINNLSNSAMEIGNITALIQSIAKRTNLLALNASIEAARGGEAGRGFAVVASEVKELAAQTSRATEEISGKIRAMQSSTSNSVHALKLVSDQIEQLEATAISIASAVDQQSVAGQDLARNIDLAARSTDEVSGSMTELQQASKETGAAATQVLGSATDLERQSTNLYEQVGDFVRHVRQSGAS